MSVVEAMCRLHNYLIENGVGDCPHTHSEDDEWSMAVNGAVPFGIREGRSLPIRGPVPFAIRESIRVPTQIMDSGHHHEDDPTRQRRDRTVREAVILPREAIFSEKNLRRSAPMRT